MRYKNTIPPFPETQAYVKLVMQFYEHFGGGRQHGLQKVTKVEETGRIRVTIPGRRNMPVDGVSIPGLMAEPKAADPASSNPARL